MADDGASGTADLTRRDFAKVSAGAVLAPGARARRRYAIVGVGSRARLYLNAIQKTHAAHAELVAACDVNPGRLALARQHAVDAGRAAPAIYLAADFDKMMAEAKPEVVIVTTVDAAHDEYLCRAMAAGADVITEKPMTTDADKCRRILETRRKTGRRCTVAFNYRYMPVRSQVKELLASGVIGDVVSVDFHWMLDTHHGADYFRRWHSEKRFSGGLMVHKATHHFDLVNWWLSAVPVTVRASGRRAFYTPAMARRLGLAGPHARCLTCPEKQKCGFELDLARSPELKSLYLDQEKHDGYHRDRCVFRPDIDIEDSMSVTVGYDSDAVLTYSLTAFAPWEGYAVTFNGSKGRLEHKVVEKPKSPDPNAGRTYDVELTVHPLRKPAYAVTPRAGEGGHGGGDPVMLDDLFTPGRARDPLLRAADERSGAYSILVGVAANRSFIDGSTIRIGDLVSGLVRPDYPLMPSRTTSVPMPDKRR